MLLLLPLVKLLLFSLLAFMLFSFVRLVVVDDVHVLDEEVHEAGNVSKLVIDDGSMSL